MEDEGSIDCGDYPRRGRLKIFFGACAGVGKTYAMLSDAYQRREEGIDAFVGVIETHGRGEVARLVEGLPRFPLQTIHHRGATLKELSLDSVLARKPGLILIDELAHTNAPGSRHPKRWQDVEELLGSGIDVHTTLNVQHLESLNDIVANITGIQVRETVPDALFDAAAEIALIDVPPDEILKRLKEGKIYLAPDVRERAIAHFFKKSNLIALRELALRRAAERVDAQMAQYNAGQGLKEPLVAERILVCVGDDALSARVVRHVKRMATRSRAPWTAVYVETSRHTQAQKNAERNLRLAERMGARIKILKGGSVADAVIAFAREHHFTRVIAGRPMKPAWRSLLFGSLADRLVRRGENMEITIIPGMPRRRSAWPRISWQPRSLAYAALAAGLCTAVGLPFRGRIDAVNFGMVYLVGVAAVAVRFGLFPSIAASLIGVTAFNFFFTEPYYSLRVYDVSYLVTFAVLAVAGILISSLASHLRRQAMFFREREIHTHALYGLTKELAASREAEAMAEAVATHVRQAFDCIVSVLLPDENNALTGYPGKVKRWDVKEEAVARWCFEHRQPAGLGTTTMPGSSGLYLPLAAEGDCLGVLNLKPGNARECFTREELGLLDTFASLIASALQRANAARLAEQASVEAEAERLRNTLLSSVSHDLRTPLASLRGSIEAVLSSSHAALSGEASDLLESACRQSERLTRMVSNLLDINRLESGMKLLGRQPYYIEEIIGAAIAHVKPWLQQRELTTGIPAPLPLVSIDGARIEQVLVNLLENAIKYTPENGVVHMAAEKQGDCIRVCVSDNGCGVPAGEEQKIFEKFYRVAEQAAKQGSGLGLAICKAIIVAHGGSIGAKSNQAGGMSVAFTLPLDNALLAAEAELKASHD